SYLLYWGKTRKGERKVERAPCHLLAYHALDVAAVGELILSYDRHRKARLAKALDLDPEVFHLLFVFSLVLHDLGKFARSFQGQAEIAECDLVSPVPGKIYDGKHRGHTRLGTLLWDEVLRPKRQALRTGCFMTDLDLQESCSLWLGCFFGHHGQPVMGACSPLEIDFLEEDFLAAEEFVSALEALWGEPWPVDAFSDEHWRDSRLAPVTWELAGLVTLADWLGSNTEFFPCCVEPMLLEKYWENRALPQAQQVLAKTGFARVPRPIAFPGFVKSFNLQPTPLQEWAASATLAEEPQLMILEDLTGSGKTEAALTLAHRFL
ncbi:CRISPR-associated endonuclease Cas3'', partial [Halorhodospira halochloris]|uniref:CRISPR-associated endonuclease Cas3'' n=1 Tax=Halorhodospira halochloris TaxID=1052 RepID=UPI001EE85066